MLSVSVSLAHGFGSGKYILSQVYHVVVMEIPGSTCSEIVCGSSDYRTANINANPRERTKNP